MKILSGIYALMLEGIAIHEFVFDNSGAPIDYIITDVNPSFERITGLKRNSILGKKITEIFSLKEAPFINLYYKVESTGASESFETYFPPLDKHLLISVFSHEKGKFVTVFQDITDRKHAEEKLIKSQQYFHSVLDNSLDFIYRVNLQTGQYEYASPSIINVLGYSVDEFTSMDSKKTMDKIYPDDLPFVLKSLKELEESGSVVIDYRILQKQGNYRWIENHFTVTKDNNGLPLYRDGIVHDITDRKKAEEAIAASEQEFRLLTESMPQIVWTTTPDGQNSYFNHKWIEYTGLTLEESYGHGWNKPFHPDDQQRAWDAWQNAVQHNAAYLLQCRLRRFDGVYRWWLIHGVPVVDKNGTITKWYGTCTDIDEMKNANDTIRHNEELLRSVIENVSSGVALIDDEGKFTVYNPLFLQLFGLKENSTINNVNDQNWAEWQVFNEDGSLLDVNEHPVRKAAITGKRINQQLVGVKLPSGGDIKWLLISAEPMQKEDGSLDKIICTYHDISKRKKAEEALKESELTYKLLVNSIPETSIMLFDSRMRFKVIGGEENEKNKFDKSKIEGKTLREAYPKDVADLFEPIYQKALKGIPTTFEMPFGQYVYLQQTIPVKNAGNNVIGAMQISTDITNRKRFEETLAFQSQLLSEVNDAVFSNDTNYTITYWNQAAEKIFGWAREEALGKNSRELLKPKVDGSSRDLERSKLKNSGNWKRVVQYIRKDGKYFYSDVNSKVLKDDNGKDMGNVVIVRDITERKKIDDQLKESEERFHTMADAIPQLAWIAHGDGYIYWYNQRWYQYTGTTQKQMEGWGWQSVHDPKILTSVLERWKNSIDKGNPFDMEFPIRGADGIFRPFLTRVMPLKDSKGQVVQWIGTNTDITERKKAEETLKDSQEKLELALSTGNVGIWEWNLITNEVSWDQRTNEILHVGKKDIKRTRDEFMQLINEEDIPQINKAIKETLEKDIPFDTIFKLKVFTEEPVYISSKAKAIKDNNGKAIRLP